MSQIFSTSRKLTWNKKIIDSSHSYHMYQVVTAKTIDNQLIIFNIKDVREIRVCV